MADAAGPNDNTPWMFFDPVDLAQTVTMTFAATQRALALADKASPSMPAAP